MNLDFESIATNLARLRSATPPPSIFGSKAHGFQLNPPATESGVRKFEKKHAIALPTDYRQFITEVANGGAGPCYGLFRLGEMDKGAGHAPWEANDGFVGILSVPFPHTEPWNDLTGMPSGDDVDKEDLKRKLAAFEQRYWNTANVKWRLSHMSLRMLGARLARR
jgi:hypothetical protein